MKIQFTIHYVLEISLTDLLSNQNCDSTLIDYENSRTDIDQVILERYRVSVSYELYWKDIACQLVMSYAGKISRVS